MGRHFLGIDESNHGRDPEIYVGVFSNNIDDIIKHEELIGKKRATAKTSSSALFENIFAYIMFRKEERESIGDYNMKAIAFFELIKFFSGLDRIIIDGELRKTDYQKLQSLMGTHPGITAESKADQHYKIVNTADHIANILYRHYSNLDNIENNVIFKKNLIIPNSLDSYLILE